MAVEVYKSISDFLQLDSTQTTPHPQTTYRAYKTYLIALKD